MSSNVFESLDMPDAADLAFRSNLLMAIINIIERARWDQTEICQRLDVPQPRVSELMNGKLHLLSSDRLIGYARKLGYQVSPDLVAL